MKKAAALGREILQALSSLMEKIDNVTPIPGEGLERHLRTLLRDSVFIDILGWPPDKLISGELYDLYGHDTLNYEVLYVETKTPNAKQIRPVDVESFQRKLERLGTAEHGAITNGHTIATYSCSLKEGSIVSEQTAVLDLGHSIANIRSGHVADEVLERIGEAFAPFAAKGFIGERRKSFEEDYGRITLRRGDTRSIQRLSGSLREAVSRLTGPFLDMLDWLYATQAPIGKGKDEGFSIEEPMDDWSAFSGRVPVSKMRKQIESTIGEMLDLRHQDSLDDSRIKLAVDGLRKTLGVPIATRDLTFLISQGLLDAASLDESLRQRLYEIIRSEVALVFARQTAYVVLSRILLYRASEDKHFVARRLSGRPLDSALSEFGGGSLQARDPAVAFRSLIDGSEDLMSRVFYSHLYAHGLFDWWRVPDSVKREWPEGWIFAFGRLERAIDIALEASLVVLNRYNLKEVQRDIWKDVYQEYLPILERGKLGGFYTPDEIVDVILDLVGYVAEAPELCKKDILDPACGSGTFLVEATRRLRLHLEDISLSCHSAISALSDESERSWAILTRIKERTYGLDIHPFACFLTEMNLLFLMVDLLLSAKRLNPQRRVEELNVGCDDSLRAPGEPLQLSLSYFSETNSRAELTVRDRAKASMIKRKSFSYVVGNPPWSGVLRGSLSPLFDETAKKVYATYRAATGKYDIYALFLERGIQWLQRGGTLGFITQNRFLRRRYGRGVRGVIKDHCEVQYILDLGNAGPVIFGRSNYPAISIFKRSTA